LLRSPAPKAEAINQVSPQTGSASNSAYAHSAADLILDFFDRDDQQFEPDKPWSKGAQACGLEALGGLGTPDCPDDVPRYQITFLIATVPAPDSLPLRYKSDTYLDAIQRAANTAGFNLYSFDLPWLKTAEQQSPSFRLGQSIDIEQSAKMKTLDILD